MTRIVCWFSCGAASAVATKIAIAENAGKRPIEVVRCIVAEEHPDNDRFAADCERWFGVPIINLTAGAYGGSVHAVIEARKYVSGVLGAPCTRILKKEVREAYQRPTDTHVFGYCADEQDRWDRFLDANNIGADAPLIRKGVLHSECLALIQNAGIALPVMYTLGYQHNNCIGCVKATGAGYWNKIRDDFPVQFDRMAAASRKFGARMVKVGGDRMFLDELPRCVGDYQAEPEIQCGIFCEMAQQEYA